MFNLSVSSQNDLQIKISSNYRNDEADCVHNLLKQIQFTEEENLQIKNLARELISKVRDTRIKGYGVDAIMQEFKLSTEEGIALMCLAESLLRIPDKSTQDALIRDKVSSGDWSSHMKTGNIFVSATSWGLMITGKLVTKYNNQGLKSKLLNIVAKGGEPIIRKAMSVAVRLMGNQFVMGQTIEDALKNAESKELKGYQFSYDMLGEAAMTNEDALKYLQSYVDALNQVGRVANLRGIHSSPGISVKLSAIHPRYQRMKIDQVFKELYPRLKQLFMLAKQYDVGLFIDAEETERLEISLALLKQLLNDSDLDNFEGIGFVVQAYQKRAPFVIDYIYNLAKDSNRRIMVRLVKGAYWDSEIKKAQLDGQIDYPVYTRKVYTDLSYLVCAKKLFGMQDQIYPLFATHNAHTLAAINIMGSGLKYEFQCLYGMGETLYDNVIGSDNLDVTCRVYAPVGTYQTLLAYLVRRLLENGANSSFVHQIVDKTIPIENLIIDPIAVATKLNGSSNPYFNKPLLIYPKNRVNSRGLDLSDESTLQQLQIELNKFAQVSYTVKPFVKNLDKDCLIQHQVVSPANKNDIVGMVIKNEITDIDFAVNNAKLGFLSWSKLDIDKRAEFLFVMANLLEDNYIELLSILVREAGKTLNNAIAEIREAVDFCRYYATEAITNLKNISYQPRGIIACISPWNFPLAIFLGEISSALVAGNCVIAKPSAQTNIIAHFAVQLFYKAGVPTDALQLIIGSGSTIGNLLTKHIDVAGVIFTGSTEVARQINQNLSSKSIANILIAETGGQNAMIVDSTALPEQVVSDVITSGFDSAGQRCSALRVLYLQSDIADKVIHMLKGAMDELYIGNPCNLYTDIGPVIDTNAQKILLDHIDKMKLTARMIYQSKLSDECGNGIFVPPTLIEISSINELEREIFGPIVHIIRFDSNSLNDVIDEINSSGYGLTSGLHSRLDEVAQLVYNNIHAGNIYINRNMVGAVVGVQPFGGEGLSGTGPKAGGPLYLYKLVHSSDDFKIDNIEVRVGTKNCFSPLNCFIAGLKSYGFNEIECAELSQLEAKCKQQTLVNKQVQLSGPTGENNFMQYFKRGYVGCFANNSFDLARQIIYALSSGNDIIIPRIELVDKMKNYLPANTIYADSIDDYINASIVLVAGNFEDVTAIKDLFSKKEGPLVNMIFEYENSYDISSLVLERSISINVTATGGNVQLMSINDFTALN